MFVITVRIQVFHYLHQRINHLSNCIAFHVTLLAEKAGRKLEDS